MVVGVPEGSSWSFLAMEHPSGAAFEPQYNRELEPEYFPFLRTVLHIPRKIFMGSCPILSNVIIQANKHKTHGEKNSQPGPDSCFCKSQVLPCKFTGEERTVKNSPCDAGALYLCQLTAISSTETYPLRTGALLACALPAVTAILITLSANSGSCTSFWHPLQPDHARKQLLSEHPYLEGFSKLQKADLFINI